MNRFLFFVFFIVGSYISAQSTSIIGTVISEFGDKLPYTLIINIRTEDRAISDKEGHFIIDAKPNDEIRFIRNNYERLDLKLADEDFTKPTVVKLKAYEHEIPELKLGFVPTGNLKKDILRLEKPSDQKVASLNKDLDLYLRSGKNILLPKNNAGNSFNPIANLNHGSLDLLGLAKGISKLVGKAVENPKTQANYHEKEVFYKKVRTVIDVEYFANAGIVDYDLDRLIAYTDTKYELSKLYRNNFDISKIEYYLKLALSDFKIKTAVKNKPIIN